MSRGRAIWQAYSDTNALAIPCTNCQAEKGIWCTKPDGRVSKVPCVARIAAADLTAHQIESESASLSTPALDFSEPRRPHDNQPEIDR